MLLLLVLAIIADFARCAVSIAAIAFSACAHGFPIAVIATSACVVMLLLLVLAIIADFARCAVSIAAIAVSACAHGFPIAAIATSACANGVFIAAGIFIAAVAASGSGILASLQSATGIFIASLPRGILAAAVTACSCGRFIACVA